MTDAAAVDLKALLEGERESLVNELDELGFGVDGALSYDSNFADTSQVTAERGEAEALANKLKEALEEAENALAKMKKGTYGTCENCHKPISRPRLEAMPASTYCIDCASKKR